MAITKKSAAVQEVTEDQSGADFGDATEMAATPVNKAPVATPQGGQSHLSDDEMKDLDFGFGAFPTITLDKGEFECSGDIDLGDSFDVKIMRWDAKYFYSSKISDADHEFFYSFNKVETVSGEQVVSKIAEWKEEGRPDHTVKKYLEVTAQIMSGDNTGEVVLLSISPTSVTRFSGYVAGALSAVRNVRFDNVITTVSAGDKITKGKFNWKPWDFKFKSNL